MRKISVFPIFLATVFVAGVAFGASVRGGRSVASTLGATEESSVSDENTDVQNPTVAARAANRNRVRQNVTSAPVTTTEPTAARVANRNRVKQNTATVAPAKPGVAARSATKQKAVNMGTKIATADENTVLPKECQDAFYGCMDSFCMLDNTSGGRCRCDARGAELDAVLEQIQALDAQSKTLAEQGVERLKLGDAVDEIYSMAEDAANKALADQKRLQKDAIKNATSGDGSKARSLDLSAFNNNLFDTDDLFGGGADVFDTSSMTDKTGQALRNEATKLCAAKIPTQCKEYSSMLQLVYAQKIKSDCVAYENDLKKQKINSENLLKTAQKAVRDAAAEAYENANKYDLGQCVLRFKQCMTGEEACGTGFSKCVVNKLLVSSSSKKMKKIKTGTTVIEVESTTFDSLSNKKPMCEHVLKQCTLVQDKVWEEFLKNVVPELKSAEYVAEEEQRRDCSKNIINCIKEAAVAEGLQEGTDNWALFTTDTENVRRVCKVQIQQCNAYDSDMEESILNYVKLSLNAVRADRCTTSIKTCLQKDTNCGADYAACVGVGIGTMWKMCKEVVEVDCAGKTVTDKYGNDLGLEGYVWQVAQGLILNIDNKLAERCQNIINSAMIQACGGTNSCSGDGATVSDGLIEQHFRYMICPSGYKKITQCVDNVAALANKTDAKNWSVAPISEVGGPLTYDRSNIAEPFKSVDDALAKALNAQYQTIISSINSYNHVQDCILGRSFEGLGAVGQTAGRTKPVAFKNLTSSVIATVGQSLYNNVMDQMNTKRQELEDRQLEDMSKISQLYATTKAEKQQACKDYTTMLEINATERSRRSNFTTTFNEKDNKCTVCYTQEYCYDSDYDSENDKCNKWTTTWANGDGTQRCITYDL